MKYNRLWKEEYLTRIVKCENPEETVKETHSIVILTEWDEFKDYKYEDFFRLMEKPSYLFDGRNLLDEKKMVEIGYRYQRVGKKFESISLDTF